MCQLGFMGRGSTFCSFFFQRGLSFCLSGSPKSFFASVLSRLYYSPSKKCPQFTFAACYFSRLRRSVSLVQSDSTEFSTPTQQVPTGVRPTVLYRALGVTPKDITDKLTTGLTTTDRATEPLFYVPASVTVTIILRCSA